MKPYKLIISPAAYSDIEETVYYYNSKQRGLGKKFARVVKYVYAAI